MITNILLNLLYYAIILLTSPLRLLPDATIPAEITGAVNSAKGYLGAIDFIVPVNTLIAVIGAFFVVEFAIFSYKIIMWVIKKIPGIN